jgi:hypothetical protein
MIPLAYVENLSAVRYYICPEGEVCQNPWGSETQAQPLFQDQSPCIGNFRSRGIGTCENG